jgi:hypothetical protein
LIDIKIRENTSPKLAQKKRDWNNCQSNSGYYILFSNLVVPVPQKSTDFLRSRRKSVFYFYQGAVPGMGQNHLGEPKPAHPCLARRNRGGSILILVEQTLFPQKTVSRFKNIPHLLQPQLSYKIATHNSLC